MKMEEINRMEPLTLFLLLNRENSNIINSFLINNNGTTIMQNWTRTLNVIAEEHKSNTFSLLKLLFKLRTFVDKKRSDAISKFEIQSGERYEEKENETENNSNNN